MPEPNIRSEESPADPQIVAMADPQVAAMADPQVAVPDPQVAAMADPQIVAMADPQVAASADPQVAASADPNLAVTVKCVLNEETRTRIINAPLDATFRFIRKSVGILFNGDGCVLLMNGNIVDDSQKLLDAEFQKYACIIAINAMDHAKSYERYMNMC
jgi:hypothetical protein